MGVAAPVSLQIALIFPSRPVATTPRSSPDDTGAHSTPRRRHARMISSIPERSDSGSRFRMAMRRRNMVGLT